MEMDSDDCTYDSVEAFEASRLDRVRNMMESLIVELDPPDQATKGCIRGLCHEAGIFSSIGPLLLQLRRVAAKITICLEERK
jgi:hypothetical protein